MDVNASTYSDYMMLISPPDVISNEMDRYKRATLRLIGDFDGAHSRPHISIAGQHRQMPVTMLQKLDFYQRAINRMPAVPLYVNGFGYFKNDKAGKVIFAKIEMNGNIEKWFRQLRRIFGENASFVPHITVAKSLSDADFRLLWPNFVNKQYQHEFTPQHITVLSRPMIGGRDKYWTPFKDLYFNNFG